MGIFGRLFGTENRAEGMVEFENALLEAMTGAGRVTKEMALQVPTISGAIDLIANIIASTPIKLYRERDGRAEEVKGDARITLLNDEPGDTLNANEFWRAMVRDYYTGKGGYAYINRSRGKIRSLHYVKEEDISIARNADPIFKDYDILAGGGVYKPWDFFKILRNTRDGAEGVPITSENSRLIAASFLSIQLEQSMAERGGNKKGFFKAEKSLDDAGMEKLRAAYRNLYSNGSSNAMVLNRGIDFTEASDTAAEMQLNENKKTNAEEFSRIFHISPEVIGGSARDISGLAKLAATPLMEVIQCALNRDLLLEREKGELYFAFDTKELLRGEMKDRFEAYKTALDANFMQIDEVRFAEDLEPLGLNWIKLGLQDVLYDPKTQTIYTPNTNQTGSMRENSLRGRNSEGNIEPRANPYHDERGRFTSAAGGSVSLNLYDKPTGFDKNKNGEKTLDKAERERYSTILLGRKTSDGITIKSLSEHVLDRAAQRSISPGEILDTLNSQGEPSKTDVTCRVYNNDGKRTVVNSETGCLVTIMRRRQ